MAIAYTRTESQRLHQTVVLCREAVARLMGVAGNREDGVVWTPPLEGDTRETLHVAFSVIESTLVVPRDTLVGSSLGRLRGVVNLEPATEQVMIA